MYYLHNIILYSKEGRKKGFEDRRSEHPDVWYLSKNVPEYCVTELNSVPVLHLK